MKHGTLSHFSVPFLNRSNDKLISLDDSIIKLRHQYNILSHSSVDDEKSDIAFIINIGQKRQGKSLNATVSSIMLSDDGGCIFPMNMIKNNDLQTTFGCDISPPLPIIQPLPWTKRVPHIGNIKYLSIVDVEGMSGANEDMIRFVKETFIAKHPCILVLSSLLSFDENDLNLLRKLYEPNCRNPLILALSSANIDEIEYSSNYLKIKNEIEYFGELRLCQLPFFDEGRKEKAHNAQNRVFASPLEHMTHSEKTQYFNLALQILETMTECNKSDNYLGISSEDVMEILDGIEKRALFKNFEENRTEKLL